jgi:hypothetical protein
MDKRAEPRVNAEKKVEVTVLGDQPVTFPARVVNLSGRGMRLLSDHALGVGFPVGVEWDDSLLLGDVCYCESTPEGYAIGLELEQRLLQTADLVRLAGQMAGDPERAPEADAAERRRRA